MFNNVKRRIALKTILCVLALSASAPLQSFAASQAATQDKIIVSGASGQLGELVVKELLARGVAPQNLILVSRTPEKLADYAKQGASVRFGDFAKPESLSSAYAGGTKMLLISIMPGPNISRPEMHKAGIDAAAKAGVKHIVYTSFEGAGTGATPIAVDHQKTEAYLKASGVAWTALRYTQYAEYGVLQPAIQMASTGRATMRPNETKRAPITRTDCAAAAAGALTTPGHENKVYEVTGPALIDTRDIAKAVTEVTGKPVAVVVSDAASTGAAGMGGPDGPGPGANPPPATVTTAVADLSGRPATTIRALLQANKDKLSAGAK